MDLGIAGRSAVVCASSRGLGKACAEALADAGVNLVINGRDAGSLETTAAGLRERFGVTVTAVAADATTDAGLAQLVAACPAPDILVNNAGGPPPGDWRSFSREDWHKAIDANLLAATFLIRAYADGMGERGFGRIVNITSAMVKAPNEILSLSVAARLGLTGFVRGIAPGFAGKGVTINNLLPEQFETERLRKNLTFIAEKKGVSLEDEIASQTKSGPAGRFGRPEEFGATCAFMCSVHAGYMTGQNILLDGGRFQGVF
ncbi:MAG: 3-oxoacyl-ACP reductase [Phenylobacterium sp.]|nr:3-oxoacyl-ACP reductase [Phenylobacterium sp.]